MHACMHPQALAEALHPAGAPSMSGKGVASVRSRVVNLRELQPALDEPALLSAIAAEFCAVHGLPPPPPTLPVWDPFADAAQLPGLAEIAADFAGWQWTFGQTPPFTVRHPLAFRPAVSGSWSCCIWRRLSAPLPLLFSI
jgi:lipoate-protein ligase A